MKRNPSPTTLARDCRAEPAHAARVTELAVDLFDRTWRHTRLPPAARRLLAAACTLHDAGYAVSPRGHARRSAGFVLQHGLAGFTRNEQRMIAAIIRLHPRRASGSLRPLAQAGLPCTSLVLRLAAYLRVADALDHGHIQDVSICSVRRSRRGFTVSVHCAAYPGSLPYAITKADLWQRVCPLPIRFTLATRPPADGLYRDLLHFRQPVREAAYRILGLQYRVACDMRAATAAGSDPAGLHDLRVALRRFRTALRFFRRPLHHNEARALEDRITVCLRHLSPHRDHEVWIRFLAASLPSAESEAAASVHLRQQRRLQERERARLVEFLTHDDLTALLSEMAHFVRSAVPPPLDSKSARPFGPFAARRLRRAARRLFQAGPVCCAVHPETVHAHRKHVRRLRYYAEMAAPALGGTVAKLRRRLKHTADVLGDVHDADVFMERLARQHSLRALQLTGELRARRTEYGDLYLKAWRDLSKPAFRKRAITHLKMMENTP